MTTTACILLGLAFLSATVFVGCLGVFVGFCLARIDDLYRFTEYSEEARPKYRQLPFHHRSLN